ncbi:Fc.00g096390.m01.CDS01 [Cosmosporella sp. VM-42]
MPKLALYRKNGSCAFVPHSILLHCGISATTIPLRVGPDGYEAADGSFSHQEYLSVHPLGYVPALDVDGEIITELPAIVTYIASLVPDKKLVGNNSLEKAKVTEWLVWLSGTLHSLGFAGFWRPYRFSNEKAAFKAISAKGRTVVEQSFERIENRLKGSEFAVGNALTVVDFNFYIFSRWGKEIGIDMEDQYPNYSIFARKMEFVEGVKKAIEVEGLEYSFR